MKFDNHDPQKMNPNYFGDLLGFLLASGTFWFLMKDFDQILDVL